MGTNGGYGQARPRLTPEDRQDILRRHDAGESAVSIARDYGVSSAAIYYHLKATMRHVPLKDRDTRDEAPPPPDTERERFQPFDAQPWADYALCTQTDPELFFPEKGGSTREAKSICAACTVRAECLMFALEHRERFGIWGGMSERARRRLMNDNDDREEEAA
jgi:WhiB family redox-sensing transcriptional regulator